MLGLVATLAALSLLGEINWPAYPFLLEHTLIATGLYLFRIAELHTVVAITRLLGGYIVNANDRPLTPRTPAEFWRRYNRLVGQFLHKDVFKPMQGRRHPLRATLGVFAVSGLLHEYLYWMVIGRSAGLLLLFFMMQGCAVALTLRIKPVDWRAVVWGLGTFAFNILSSVLFLASFHYIIPVCQNGLPEWLRAW